MTQQENQTAPEESEHKLRAVAEYERKASELKKEIAARIPVL